MQVLSLCNTVAYFQLPNAENYKQLNINKIKDKGKSTKGNIMIYLNKGIAYCCQNKVKGPDAFKTNRSSLL